MKRRPGTAHLFSFRQTRYDPWHAGASGAFRMYTRPAGIDCPPVRSRLCRCGLRRDARGLSGGSTVSAADHFLGCSPHLQLEPPADGSEDFCHIRLRGPFRTARLLSAGNTRPPRCPGCGKGLTNWRQLESLWAKGGSGSEIGCAACGRSANPAELDWRRKAGFGRYFIEISSIFPEEALPLPALMECLRDDGAEWRYFYLQDW